ncbi:MAG: NUDIX domain-containing protein [Candidatus Pacearchaeota archaeon]|nr:NUDIX domain-containing protein [Candidatus Pacearchaeota archaeon]
MAKEKIIIVDKNDEIIGSKEIGTLDQSDIYRVSALWIQNSKGEILLTQKSFNKKNNTGKWGLAVTGIINEGESYESKIIKEAEEQINLKNCQFKKTYLHFHDGESKHFTQWFFALVDREIEEFVIEKKKVKKIKWFTKEQLIQDLNNTPNKFEKIILKCVNFFNK